MSDALTLCITCGYGPSVCLCHGFNATIDSLRTQLAEAMKECCNLATNALQDSKDAKEWRETSAGLCDTLNDTKAELRMHLAGAVRLKEQLAEVTHAAERHRTLAAERLAELQASEAHRLKLVEAQVALASQPATLDRVCYEKSPWSTRQNGSQEENSTS
jgi:DNA repair ATPase RecN